jgi:uncharacterized membrane protein HdeD (DUF308 family)
MKPLLLDEKVLDKFGPYTLVTGILLIVLGMAGIILPGVMSLGTAILVAWLLLTGGALWAVHTYKHNPTHVMDWLKPFLLFITGGLMLVYPASGVAAVGLLLAIYLLLDAYGSFALAQTVHPAKGWGWMMFNGVLSFLMALLFLIGWPSTSLWLVGLYVGISLLFDGLALVVIGWTLRKGKPS